MLRFKIRFGPTYFLWLRTFSGPDLQTTMFAAAKARPVDFLKPGLPKLFLLSAVPRALALVSQAGATNISETENSGGTTRPCKQTGLLFASSDDLLLTEVEKSALPQASLSAQAIPARSCCPTFFNHGRHLAQTCPAVPQCPTRLATLSFSKLTQPCAIIRIDLRLSSHLVVGGISTSYRSLPTLRHAPLCIL